MDEKVKKVIRDCLSKLYLDLQQFDMTTHGLIGEQLIDNVGSYLVKAYMHPDSYHISSLSQSLEGFLSKH